MHERIAVALRRFRAAVSRRDINVIVAGAVCGNLFSLVAAPVLTRLYSPADFGALGVYSGVLGVVSVVASMRLEVAINIAESDRVAANVLAAAVLASVCVACLCAAVLCCCGDALARTGIADPRALSLLLPAAVLGLGTVNALTGWSLRQHRYSNIGRTKGAQAVVMAAGQVAAGAAKLGGPGLIAGDVVSRFAGLMSLGSVAWRRDADTLRHVSARGVVAAVVRYRRFPLVASGSAVLNALGLQLPVVLVATKFGQSAAGHYLLVQRVFAAPLALIGQAVGMYYVGRGGALLRTDPVAMLHLFRRATRRLVLACGVPIVVAALLAPTVCAAVFGPAWSESGRYALALGGVYAAQVVVVPVSQTLNLLERQDIQLIWDAGRCALVCVVLLAAASTGMSALAALACYAAVMVVAYGALYCVSVAQLRRAVARNAGEDAGTLVTSCDS